MTPRETRLRQRIDTLTDQRDRARSLTDTLATRVDELEAQVAELKAQALRNTRTGALRQARQGREAWRQRAESAEQMLNQIHRQRRRGATA